MHCFFMSTGWSPRGTLTVVLQVVVCFSESTEYTPKFGFYFSPKRALEIPFAGSISHSLSGSLKAEPYGSCHIFTGILDCSLHNIQLVTGDLHLGSTEPVAPGDRIFAITQSQTRRQGGTSIYGLQRWKSRGEKYRNRDTQSLPMRGGGSCETAIRVVKEGCALFFRLASPRRRELCLGLGLSSDLLCPAGELII